MNLALFDLKKNFGSVFNQRPPRFLHHYSSTQGALAILGSGRLWASNVQALNDIKEVDHALDVLMHAFENYLGTKFVRDADDVKKILNCFLGAGNLSLGHCVCSFSESGDLLSQWRAYGADGGGIAVAFNSNLLRKDAEAAGFRIGKCIYDYQKQYQICEGFIAAGLAQYDVTTFVDVVPDTVLDMFREFVYTVGIFLKHPAFVDEREWRLVSGQNHIYSERWKYRSVARGLSSYIELELPSIFCSQQSDEDPDDIPHLGFTIGPKVRRTPTNQILQALSFKILGVGYGVTQSSVPYVD